jgi:hypothetical protein
VSVILLSAGEVYTTCEDGSAKVFDTQERKVVAVLDGRHTGSKGALHGIAQLDGSVGSSGHWRGRAMWCLSSPSVS